MDTTTDTRRRPPRPLTRRGLLGGAVALLAGAGGGTAWALDRFVVEHPEVTNASSTWETDATASGAATGAVSGTTYSSDNATIGIRKVVTGTGAATVTSFVADLSLTAGTGLRAAFASDTFGANIVANPSVIAKANGAVFAINGDYYGFRDTGIVIRNGTAFRDRGARQGLAVFRDGSMQLFDETATSASALVASGVWHTLSFGPGLVADGAVIPGIDAVEVDTNVGNHSIQGYQPRTGIGMVGPNHFVAVVTDGRSSGYSRGVTMSEFAALFTSLGATVAYNLDGGGSSTMVFDGSVVNNPLGRGDERGTSDILYVVG